MITFIENLNYECKTNFIYLGALIPGKGFKLVLSVFKLVELVMELTDEVTILGLCIRTGLRLPTLPALAKSTLDM